MVLADVGSTDGGMDSDAGPQQREQPQPASQRITPYMSKVAPRPTSATKPHTPATAGKFAERQNAGSVVSVLNPHLAAPQAAEGEADAMDVDGGQQGQRRCEFQVLGQPLAAGSKYMVDRLEDKVGGCVGGWVLRGWVGGWVGGVGRDGQEGLGCCNPKGLAHAC